MTDLKHFDDLTAIDCPCGELDTDTIGRLVRAWMDGDDVELLHGGGVWHRLVVTPSWKPHATYRLAPKPLSQPSVDWSHVGAMWNWMATDADGFTHLSTVRPDRSRYGWTGGHSYLKAKAFASFAPGTCDWKDSLVMRPGYEGE